ncbi:hypothetical protein ACUH93_00595 [Dermabacteraceae bacterium P7006]
MNNITIQEATGDRLEGITDEEVLIRIITPGTGSSGIYSAAVLEQAAADKIFHAGMLMFADHPTDEEKWERPERSVKDVAGALTTDAWWDGEGLAAKCRLTERWRALVKEVGQHIGLSIRAEAEATSTADGPVIDRFVKGHSVDLVTYAGRGGKFLTLYESAPGPTYRVQETTTTKEKENMEIKESEYKDLTEKASRVAALETERDQARKDLEEAMRERDAAVKAAAHVRAEADLAKIEKVIAESGVAFTDLERLGLRASIKKTEEGRIDVEAFQKTVTEAAAARQPGVTGVGATNESGDISEDELNRRLGISK